MDEFVTVAENNAVATADISEYLKENADKLHSYLSALAEAAELFKGHCSSASLSKTDLFNLLVFLNYFNYASQDIARHVQSMLKALGPYMEKANESRRNLSEVNSKEN